MNVNAYDPFLYRTRETDLEKRLSAEKSSVRTDKQENGFATMLDSRLKREADIPSAILSRDLSKAQIKAHIGTNPQRKALYEAAEQFEAYFMEQVFKEMKKTAGKSGLIHGGFAEDIFDEMLTTERVGQMAHNQEFGLAEKLYQQMQRLI